MVNTILVEFSRLFFRCANRSGASVIVVTRRTSYQGRSAVTQTSPLPRVARWYLLQKDTLLPPQGCSPGDIRREECEKGANPENILAVPEICDQKMQMGRQQRPLQPHKNSMVYGRPSEYDVVFGI